MNRGKWYFVYEWRDAFGESMLSGSRIEDEEIPLKATTEDEAVAEGKVIWGELVEKAKAIFAARQTWCHPPKDPFEYDGPWRPRVIYKISLEGKE